MSYATHNRGQINGKSSGSSPALLLQRKCDCGNHTMGGECDGCAKKKSPLQRQFRGGFESPEVPPIVHEVLRSPGRPLDEATRSLLEPKFGQVLGRSGVTPAPAAPQHMAISQPDEFHEREADQIAERVTSSNDVSGSARGGKSSERRYDLSGVRVHTDAQASESARAVNARAYTVGHHVVFGSGSYSPHSSLGLRLLAHELAHTAQQRPVIARAACLANDVCKDVKLPSTLVQEAKTESQKRRDERTKLCGKTPPDPGCRADRHGDRAVETEKMLLAWDRSRLAFANGIFIDRDLEKDFSALTTDCASFTPPLFSGGFCIRVPLEIEEQSKQFNTTSGPRTIGGQSADEWRSHTLEVLVHEAEHTRFRTVQTPRTTLVSGGVPTLLGKKRPTCSKDADRQSDVFRAMNELNSMLQEFPMRTRHIRENVALSAKDKTDEIEEWRDHRVRGTSQSITVSLRAARCLCGCGDANDLIKETIKFATASWSPEEVTELDQELTDARWKSMNLDWPA
ncbi:MAG TPA: DUF4157 domain-containing protein, partial [Pyrinomonadaceae bacterium]|nr:DUF4157 domain-containing protein [Pyrinomonadaceae bacterium]